MPRLPPLWQAIAAICGRCDVRFYCPTARRRGSIRCGALQAARTGMVDLGRRKNMPFCPNFAKLRGCFWQKIAVFECARKNGGNARVGRFGGGGNNLPSRLREGLGEGLSVWHNVNRKPPPHSPNCLTAIRLRYPSPEGEGWVSPHPAFGFIPVCRGFQPVLRPDLRLPQAGRRAFCGVNHPVGMAEIGHAVLR